MPATSLDYFAFDNMFVISTYRSFGEEAVHNNDEECQASRFGWQHSLHRSKKRERKQIWKAEQISIAQLKTRRQWRHLCSGWNQTRGGDRVDGCGVIDSCSSSQIINSTFVLLMCMGQHSTECACVDFPTLETPRLRLEPPTRIHLRSGHSLIQFCLRW